MKKTLFLFVSLIIANYSFSQALDGLNLQYQLTKINDNARFANQYEQDSVSGFRSGKFLNKKWIKGHAFLKNDKEFSGGFYNLDLQYDKVIYTPDIDSTARTINMPDSLERIVIGDKIIEYLKFKDGIVSGKGFFQVLVSGECKLLVKREVTFIQAKPAEPYKKATKPHFEKKYNFYIKKGDKAAFRVLKTKKSILNALSDKSKEIEAFMKKNKTKGRSYESLIKIVTYYNTLI